MKAILHKRYGSPDLLELGERDIPVPKSTEVLIKVYGATVNRTDCAILRAKPFIMRLFTGLIHPSKGIPGTDFSGVVEKVGSGVTQFKKGQRVVGFDDMGLKSHAEYLIMNEKGNILTLPDSVTYDEATASMEGAHYGINFLNKVNLKEGQEALVNGATGAIGSAIVQFLLARRIGVTAVCGTEGVEWVKSLGVENVLDYSEQDFTTSGSFDYVFDAVGKSSFGACKPILKERGIYISSELGKASQNLFLPLFTRMSKKRVKFPFPHNIKGSMNYTIDLLSQGKFKPLIDKTYPLNQVSQAFHYVEKGQKLGNVVITMV